MMQMLNAGLLIATVATTVLSQPTRGVPSSALKAGIAQFDAERLDQAKTTLTPLAKSGDADAMLYLGRIAIEQSNGDEAVDWLEQAAKKNDHSSVYQQWLSTAYSVKASAAGPFAQMSMAPSMKRVMERAVELDSANIEARVNLAQFYLQAPAMMGGGVDKARAQVAAIMKRDPYQGRLQEASVAENQKDSVAAERELRDLVASFPDSSTPSIRLASFYVTAKRYDDASRVLEERLHRSPNDGSALYQVGRVGALSGAQLDRAQTALGSYLKMPHKRGTPSIASAHWRLGMIAEAKSDKVTAKTEYETALRLDPKNAGARASLDKLK